MKSLYIKDNDIKNIDSSELILSILLSKTGLAYSLYHKVTNKFCALIACPIDGYDNNFTEKCIGFLKKEELINKNYKAVNIIFSSSKTTIVPNALFDENNINDIFELNHNLNDNEKLLHCNLPKSGSRILFSIDNKLYKSISEIFPQSNFYSQAYSFIEHHYQKNKIAEDLDKDKMFIQVFEDYIDIIVFQKNELSFYNNFKYKTNNDILYFIINVFEQLKLSQTDTTIGFSGFIDTDNMTILNLRKFVGVVYFESQNSTYNYHYKFQETAPHYFYNLLNIC